MKIFTFMLGELLTNTYFVVGEDGECVVIDPGLDGEGIAEKLSQKGLKPRSILLTHGHFDHILGVNALAARTGAEVLIHRDDEELLSDPFKNCARFFYGDRLQSFSPVRADRFLSDGDKIVCGSLHFTVRHTPGHTKGSVVFETENALFCGDTLFAYGFGRTDLYGGSPAELGRSLRKILQIPGDLKLYPGHGNTSHLDRERDSIRRYAEELSS